jgi:hypothetical protein
MMAASATFASHGEIKVKRFYHLLHSQLFDRSASEV